MSRRTAAPARSNAVAHDHDWLVVHGLHQHAADADRHAAAWLASARAYVVVLHDPAAAPADDRSRPSVKGQAR